jgi:iron-sulfur cluster repair protein YtfE (RIC family)
MELADAVARGGAGMQHMDKLHDEHQQLLTLARQLSQVVARSEPPPQVELFELRNKLASTLIAHLKTEDWALYPELFRNGDATVSATARRFNDEMGGLASDFSVYSSRWTTMTIPANWAGFCTESREIINALVKRIECEEAELYPLAQAAQRAA